MTVNSNMINQNPLLRRNTLLSEIFLVLLKDKKAETPDRNTKVGAHRWVIQRVMNNKVVVVCKFVGF
jgi:phage gp46-like protein